MDLPTISVVLPTRERPEFLVAAARSVLRQRLLPEELVVVDDAGGRGAAEALRSLAACAPVRLRVLSGPGRGPAAARNAGLRAAAGQLIAFLDDDDLWHPEKLAWQARWFLDRPGLGVLGTHGLRTARPSGRHLRPLAEPARLREVSQAALVRANRLPMSSVLARRECLEESGGFDEALPLAQDWDLWLRVSTCWQLALLPAPLTIHRLHPGQRSQSRAAMRAWEGEVVRRVLAREAGAGPLRGVACRRLAWAHCRLGRGLLRGGETEEAIHELKQAIALWPLQVVAWAGLARCALARRAVAGAARG